MITREFDLMLYQEGNLLFINANQYDSGEQWIFTLYEENGVKYTPATGAIVGVKSDGHGIINTGTVDEYGRVVINETQQMTAAAGLATFELLIDNDTHGTANFKVDVEPRPADNADLSDSDLSLIQEAVDSAAVIVEVIGDSDPSEVIGEHVDDWLDAHPEATTTVQDGAITAPKLNNSLWDKLLVSEEASGAVASFDDGADDVPVSSLKVALEPVQLGSGDPSPSNVRPIIAANGKNLANVPNATTTQDAVTAVAVDGVVTANGTPSATTYIVIGTAVLKGGVEYAISGCPNGGGSGKYGISIRDTSTHLATDYGSGATYTPTEDITVNVCIRYWYNFALSGVEFKPMIRLSSITDASFQPYQGIAVDVEGKNLYQVTQTSQTIDGVTVNINADGTLNLAGTATATIALVLGYFTPKANKSYYISGSPFATSSCRLQFQEGSTTVANQYNNESVLVENLNVAQHRIRLYIANGTNVDGVVIKPMIRYASDTDDTFEPYVSPITYPYSLGQSVYGGTVDLATGVLTVDRVSVIADPSLSWRYASGSGGYFYLSAAFPNLKRNGQVITNLLPTVTTSENFASTENCVYCATNINIKVNGVNTVSDFQTWLTNNSLQVVYEIEPTTVQLTPQEVKTLLGYNNISSSGTVDVIYHADTKLYVDKMTNVDNSVIAPTEADFVATRNYTVNDLVIVNDTLYKVTANIATGSAITPNSNVTQTTLSALIKALS